MSVGTKLDKMRHAELHGLYVIQEEDVMLGKVIHALDVGGQWRDDKYKWMIQRVAMGEMGEVKWGKQE